MTLLEVIFTFKESTENAVPRKSSRCPFVKLFLMNFKLFFFCMWHRHGYENVFWHFFDKILRITDV